MQEIGNFDVKVNVIPNGLEKYIAFTINKDLVFIDNMQFMNSSLDALVKNLLEMDFKYLSHSGGLIELVKKKESIHMNIWTVLKSFLKINYLICVDFLVL